MKRTLTKKQLINLLALMPDDAMIECEDKKRYGWHAIGVRHDVVMGQTSGLIVIEME